ncbi:hypothetical protein HDU79_003225 [Rhizoclosmatium sp. JEL0117]|nr:hypothetical protein HDU79_003225 [Rhizoclosmatium sp. JEL0117]
MGSEAVHVANELLGRIGVRVRVQNLGECVSSLFVALFEGLLRVRLDGIKRNAVERSDKVANVSVVLRAFEETVLGSPSLNHISPSKVVDGHESDIANLLLLFGDLDKALSSTSASRSASSAATGEKRQRAETPTSPKKRKPVVAFSPRKHVSLATTGTSMVVESQENIPLPATIYSGSLKSSPSNTKNDIPRTSQRAPVKHTASTSKASMTTDKKPAQTSKKATASSSSTTSSFVLPSEPRSGKNTSGVLEVVDDVERYLLTQARLKADKDLDSTVQTAKTRAETYAKQSQKAPKSTSVATTKNSTIRFNLQPSTATPAKPAPPVTLAPLQIQSSDTPHTRALKLRQQRLLQARNEALARTNNASQYVRESLDEVVKQEIAREKAGRKSPFGIGVSGQPRTKSAPKTKKRLSSTSDRRWWEGKGLFKFAGVNSGRTVYVDGSSYDERQSDQDNQDSESDYDEEVDAEYNISEVSPPSGIDAETDSRDEHVRQVFSSHNNRVPSSSTNKQTHDQETSFSGGSFHSADIDASDLPSEIEGNDMSFDFSRTGEIVVSEESGSDDDEWGYSGDGGSTGQPPISVAEKNFLAFEKLVKDELCVDGVPKATLSKTWNGQIRDRRRALDSRLHQRKRNMHNEISTFSDIRPIQVLRKEVEREAKSKHVKREREAQRQAKISLAEQNRRVVRMEQRLANAEKEVEGILRKRKMREAELARTLYDTYLSSQRELIRETSRFDRDKRRAQEEADRVKREAKEAFARDQIRLLEEELKRAKWEEEVVSKAHAEELRKLVREQKAVARENIAKIKTKLTVDENDFELQKAAAVNVMKKLKFKVR